MDADRHIVLVGFFDDGAIERRRQRFLRPPRSSTHILTNNGFIAT